LGATSKREIEPRTSYAPHDILRAVKAHVQAARGAGEAIDYLTFVPDGEPTLDANLLTTIELLRPLGIPIAVMSNASLLWREDVRAAVTHADWVSVKVDATDEDAWRHINRPHENLRLGGILDGIRLFAREFRGTLTTETMLVEGVNDDAASSRAVASFVETLAPGTAYLAVPTRPPAEQSVRAPRKGLILQAYQTLSRSLHRVELLIGFEGDAFASTGDPEQDLLGITAVHPMREEAVDRLLKSSRSGWDLVVRLITEGKLEEVEYEGRRFYLRRLPRATRLVADSSSSRANRHETGDARNGTSDGTRGQSP
jgi:wyosine [tRNA(Phe)-imidazoG37] synthetase (radical SAM superfamily)